MSTYDHTYYAANRERFAASNKKYREANREKIQARQRAWREANREKIQAARHARRQANPEKERARQRAWRAANPEKVRAYSMAYTTQKAVHTLKRRHGLSPETWAVIWDAQNGLCYLCRESMTPNKAVIDHDHTCCPPDTSCSNCRRGLACSRCNTTIGGAEDNPELLRKIAANLEAASGPTRDRIVSKSYQAQLFDLETA